MKKSPRSREEEQAHVAIVEGLRLILNDALVFHVPNGELRDKATAAKLRRMGVVAGIPDIVVMQRIGEITDIARDIFRPIPGIAFLEVKSRTGRRSSAQSDVLDWLRGAGFIAAIVTGLEGAEKVLRDHRFRFRGTSLPQRHQ